MLPVRFWDKVKKTEHGCWEWVGAVSKKASGHNYGLFSIDRVLKMAHRVAYEDAKGPIPDGLVIDHLCCNTVCVNPEHLQAVTQKTNINRGRRAASEKTH